VVGALPAASAQAQWCGSYPSGPNGPSMSPQQPYPVEVAPNTHVIHRVDCERPAAERPRRSHADRVLIDELAKRHVKTKVIHTTKAVREKPVVIEHERVVHDPPHHRAPPYHGGRAGPRLDPSAPRSRHGRGGDPTRRP
jgi:hypothetical protein